MGEAVLRSHIQVLRSRMSALPGPARIQRLDLEDNVVEFKIVFDENPASDQGKRLNFLIYEADAYPNSGGVMMSEDERDEALVEAMNERLRDPDNATVCDALLAACSELGIEDSALSACLKLPFDTDSALAREPDDQAKDMIDQVASTSHHEAGLSFEGEDDEELGESYASYIGPVLERENRPGWKKLKWQETEEQRVARRQEKKWSSENEPGSKRRKAGGGDMTLEEQRAADQQMWSSQEAFTILANELYQFQTEGNPMLEADAVDYDVHQWSVRIRGCSGPLGEDLKQLQCQFGYDYIELRLSFKEDLHPFYPPSVSVVRPRLQGKHDVLAALACHPRLQLLGWSPFQAIVDLLSSVRHFLENIARVDLSNEQNDIHRFPVGAFSKIERQLAKLGSLCEIVPLDLQQQHEDNPYKADPWAQNEMLTQSSLGAMLSAKKTKAASSTSNGKAPTFWAAGTGYGHDIPSRNKDTWDPQAMAAAQAAQDEELKDLLRSISDSLASAASCESKAGTERSSLEKSDEAAQDKADSLFELLSKSCLALFLARELSTSYTNMGDRLIFFREVYRLVKELLVAVPQRAGVILASARPHILATKASAQTFLQSLGSQASRVDLEDDVSFAKLAAETADDVERLCTLHGFDGPDSVLGYSGGGGSSSSTATVPMDDSEEDEYVRRLKGKQFEYCDFSHHAFAHQADQESFAPQARTVRLAKELAGMASLLPVSSSSSVFVRVDNKRQQLWRVLVTGPDDTPYSNGCFVFDCYFPSSYPSEPPKVLLLTTGNNSVTFNPNLYECGKVCLSLLGTWKGDRAESWDPVNSRMLQVLVSIQSLILVPEPYFNEPGFEREIGTQIGETRSREYSEPVREGCIRWAMLDHLRRKSPGFAEFSEVLELHFRLRSRKIQEVVSSWVKAAQTNAQHGVALGALQGELTSELKKLEASDCLTSTARVEASLLAQVTEAHTEPAPAG